MHLAICTPARDQVHTAFAFDLANLMGHFVSNHRSDQITPLVLEGTLIFDQRQKLAQMALDAGADWMLWIDSDMRFPCDAVDRMIGHGQPIIAANYSTRRLPLRPVAALDPAGKTYHHTTRGSQKLELVAHVGMGFMLTRRDVFETLPKPWFLMRVGDDIPGGLEGEDVYFCRKAAEFGFPTFVDDMVSQQVRHIGAFEYSCEHANIAMPKQVG
jgi:hypothetical protein